MIERLVVAYDGSEQAEAAYGAAMRIARAAGWPLHVRRVIEPATPVLGPSDPIGVLDPAPAPAMVLSAEELAAERDRAEREGRAELEGLVKECVGEGVACTSSLHEGALVDALVDTSSATDVLAVGKKGRFAHGGIGSGARALLRHSACPVLVVSEEWKPSGKVVAAFDGTTASKRALAAAREIARKTGWGLTVVASSKERTEEEARAWAGRFAPEAERVEVAPEGVRVETLALRRASSGEGHSLVAMGAYHETFIHDLLLGSAAGGALERSRAPILLAH